MENGRPPWWLDVKKKLVSIKESFIIIIIIINIQIKQKLLSPNNAIFSFQMCFISLDNIYLFSSVIRKFSKAYLTASHIYIPLGALYLMFRDNKFPT
jgi:hypothetical protein